MQTPFFGISVIFHIAVIVIRLTVTFVFRILNKERIESEIPAKNREYINAVLMLVVFLVVLYGATTMVLLSLNNKYSTLSLVDDYLNKQSGNLATNVTPVSAFTGLPEYIDLPTSTPVAIPCHEVVNYVQNEISGLRLVDYLVYTGRNFSFEARKFDAINRGLSSYQGTEAENVWLLKEIMKDDGYIFDLDPPCQNQ